MISVVSCLSASSVNNHSFSTLGKGKLNTSKYVLALKTLPWSPLTYHHVNKRRFCYLIGKPQFSIAPMVGIYYMSIGQ